MTTKIVNLIIQGKNLLSPEAQEAARSLAALGERGQEAARELNALAQNQQLINQFREQKKAVLDLDQSLSRKTSRIAELARELQKSGQASQTYRTQVAALQQTVSASARDYETCRSRLAALARQIADTQAPSDRLRASYDALKTEVEQSRAAHEGSRAALQGAEQALRQAERGMSGYRAESGRLKLEARGTAESLKEQRISLELTRRALGEAGISSTQLRTAEAALAIQARAVAQAMDQQAASTQRADTSSRAAAQGQQQLAAGTARSSGEVRQAAHHMAGMAAGLLGLQSVLGGIVQAIRVGAEFQALSVQIGAASGQIGEGGAALDYIRQQAETLGLPLKTLAGGFAQLTASAQGTDLAGQGVRDIFEGVNTAASALRLSTEQTDGALRAITQMMSKGTVQAEELRGQLSERIPGAFNIAARAMNVTTEELNAMLVRGEVVADEFLPRFAAELQKTFSGALPESTRSLDAELNRLSNRWNELLNTLAQSGVLDTVVDSLRRMIDALDEAGRTGQLQEAIRQLGSVVSLAIDVISIFTTLLIENADVVKGAAQAYIVWKAAVAGVKLIDLVAGITATTAAATASAAATGAMSASMTVAAGNARGLSAALALIGGPLGLLVAGSAAAVVGGRSLGEWLGSMSTAAREAEAAQKRLTDELRTGALQNRLNADGLKVYTEQTLLSADRVAALSDAERERYSGNLQKQREYYKELLAAAIKEQELGQERKQQIEAAREGLESIRTAQAVLNGEVERSVSGLPATTQAYLDLSTALGEASKQGVTAAEALAAITDKVDTNSMQSVSAFGQLLSEQMAAGKISIQEFEAAWAKVVSGLDAQGLERFRVTAQAAFGDSADGARQLSAILQAELAQSVKNLGLDFDALKAGLSQAAYEMQASLRSVEASVTGGLKAGLIDAAEASRILSASYSQAFSKLANDPALPQVADEFKRLRDQGVIAAEDFKKAWVEVAPAVAASAAGVSREVQDAFARMGVQTKASLVETANQAKADFETIKQSGQASSEALATAYKKYADAVAAASDGVVPAALAAEAATYGVKIALDEAGKAGITAGDDIASGMTSAATAAADAANWMDEAWQGSSQRVAGAAAAIADAMNGAMSEMRALGAEAFNRFAQLQGLTERMATSEREGLQMNIQSAQAELSQIEKQKQKNSLNDFTGLTSEITRIRENKVQAELEFYQSELNKLKQKEREDAKRNAPSRSAPERQKFQPATSQQAPQRPVQPIGIVQLNIGDRPEQFEFSSDAEARRFLDVMKRASSALPFTG